MWEHSEEGSGKMLFLSREDLYHENGSVFQNRRRQTRPFLRRAVGLPTCRPPAGGRDQQTEPVWVNELHNRDRTQDCSTGPPCSIAGTTLPTKSRHLWELPQVSGKAVPSSSEVYPSTDVQECSHWSNLSIPVGSEEEQSGFGSDPWWRGYFPRWITKCGWDAWN